MWDKIKLIWQGFFASKPPLELSYTKVSIFRFCPWKYKLIYEDGYRIPPNPYISLGLSVHRALEAFHKDGHKDQEVLFEIYNQVWVNEGFQNPQQAVHFYDKGRKMLERYFEFAQERKSEIFGVEKEFRFTLGRRVVRGIIDRIDRLPDQTYEVIDYKTHAEMWEQTRIDNDLQLTLYTLGCSRALNIQPSHLSYFFLAHNKSVSTQRSREQLDKALFDLEAVAKEIERGKYVPDTSKCVKCDFKLSCVHSSLRSANGR